MNGIAVICSLSLLIFAASAWCAALGLFHTENDHTIAWMVASVLCVFLALVVSLFGQNLEDDQEQRRQQVLQRRAREAESQ